jgi:hypothetical protein
MSFLNNNLHVICDWNQAQIIYYLRLNLYYLSLEENLISVLCT